MSTAAIATLVKMMGELPEPAHEQVVDRLREYLLDLQDELEWERLVKRTRPQLKVAARCAKEEIAAGRCSAEAIS